MPVTDKDVGITQFLGSHKPFRAVTKQTVDDFVVNEVSLDGAVVQLTELPSKDRKKKQSSPIEQAKTQSTIDNIPFEQLDEVFPNEQPKSVSTSVKALIEEDLTELVLPVSKEKEDRGKIHEWVRENIPMYVTDTVKSTDAEPVNCVRLRKKSALKPWTARKERRVSRKGRGSRRDNQTDNLPSNAHDDDTFDPRENHKRKNPDADGSFDMVPRNTFVSFVLWKRNKDTNEALGILSKILRKPLNQFTYAGTKDKRGVTTQVVRVRGISEHKFAFANSIFAKQERGRPTSMMVGNFKVLYHRKEGKALKLGDLKGNRFSLVLREVDASTVEKTENIIAAVDSLRTRGFVNYFGLQRFGSGVSATHETGFAVLRRDFEDVCRRILLPVVINTTKSGDSLSPQRKLIIESLNKFAAKEVTAKELLKLIPLWMTIERCIIESFSKDEERGMKKYDHMSAFGKLPRNLRKMYGHAVQSYLWNVMASERIKSCSASDSLEMHAKAGDMVLDGEHPGRELDCDAAVRAVTKQEEDDKSVSLHRVVIPVPGYAVQLPDTPYGEVAKEILEKEKVDIRAKGSAEYSMTGTYRWLLSKPECVESSFVPYTKRNQLINPNARLPKEIFNTIPTVNESQPTAVGSPIENAKAGSVDENEALDGEAEAKEETKSAEEEVPRKALVISFTLGCAEYATMLVRELTRMDSSRANQKSMQDHEEASEDV